jgi:hypothetical protein
MAGAKDFWQDITTGQIYAVESTPFGKILGGAGPLNENALLDLSDYEYKPKIVKWLEEAVSEKKLRRINPPTT